MFENFDGIHASNQVVPFDQMALLDYLLECQQGLSFGGRVCLGCFIVIIYVSSYVDYMRHMVSIERKLLNILGRMHIHARKNNG
jgi:hypothetical protein